MKVSGSWNSPKRNGTMPKKMRSPGSRSVMVVSSGGVSPLPPSITSSDPLSAPKNSPGGSGGKIVPGGNAGLGLQKLDDVSAHKFIGTLRVDTAMMPLGVEVARGSPGGGG